MPSSPAPAGGPRRLTRTLYRYAFLDEFVLLYPVYALLFSDTGLSVWQISSLFALWSLTGVVLEVPSGALADGTSRRRLLVLAPLLTATGFALWVLLPSYASFAVGFVLWGAGGALGSGTLEALVYEELQRLGAADRYAGIMGRARACGLVAVMAAMALAGPVFAGGGYLAVGAASVLTCLLAAATANRLPEHRGPAAGVRGWTATLRAGLAEARDDRSVRGALLLVPAVTSVFEALDEYTPLLVRDTGVADRTVPWLLLLVWAGATAGGCWPDPGPGSAAAASPHCWRAPPAPWPWAPPRAARPDWSGSPRPSAASSSRSCSPTRGSNGASRTAAGPPSPRWRDWAAPSRRSPCTRGTGRSPRPPATPPPSPGARRRTC